MEESCPRTHFPDFKTACVEEPVFWVYPQTQIGSMGVSSLLTPKGWSNPFICQRGLSGSCSSGGKVDRFEDRKNLYQLRTCYAYWYSNSQIFVDSVSPYFSDLEFKALAWASSRGEQSRGTWKERQARKKYKGGGSWFWPIRKFSVFCPWLSVSRACVLRCCAKPREHGDYFCLLVWREQKCWCPFWKVVGFTFSFCGQSLVQLVSNFNLIWLNWSATHVKRGVVSVLYIYMYVYVYMYICI